MWGARVCVGLLLVCVTAASDADKRAEIAPAPFVLGSRYGRSSPPALRVMAPRNDRFFMGSRYGKRSLSDGSRNAVGGAGAGEGGAGAGRLVCSYTGVAPLYRCLPRPPAPHPAPLLHATDYQPLRKHDEEPYLDEMDED